MYFDWRRSKRTENLWTELDGIVAVVFEHPEGDGYTFTLKPETPFESEEEACTFAESILQSMIDVGLA